MRRSAACSRCHVSSDVSDRARCCLLFRWLLQSFPYLCVPACNRTYFGDVGRTYDLEIRRPREDRLPFLCHLNFTAGGKDLGDLVQVSELVASPSCEERCVARDVATALSSGMT